jgi:hypothetical protein
MDETKKRDGHPFRADRRAHCRTCRLAGRNARPAARAGQGGPTPDIVEEWKWRGVPVWEHDGIVCTGETYKAVVKMTFAKGAALEDPGRPLQFQPGGQYPSRHRLPRRRGHPRGRPEGAHPRRGGAEPGFPRQAAGEKGLGESRQRDCGHLVSAKCPNCPGERGNASVCAVSIPAKYALDLLKRLKSRAAFCM